MMPKRQKWKSAKNVGKDPNSVPPSVNLIYPTEGLVHNPAGTLTALQVFDPKQPANTLLYKIKSKI